MVQVNSGGELIYLNVVFCKRKNENQEQLMIWAGKIAQWVKVPAVKPDNLNLSSFCGTYLEEES